MMNEKSTNDLKKWHIVANERQLQDKISLRSMQIYSFRFLKQNKKLLLHADTVSDMYLKLAMDKNPLAYIVRYSPFLITYLASHPYILPTF